MSDPLTSNSPPPQSGARPPPPPPSSVPTGSNGTPVPEHKHLWIVTGPAGCGKTTVAEYLSKHYSLPYLEGDNYHPQANIDKMAHNIPLTDADRWDWLISLRDHAVAALDDGAEGVVLTCSALKRKYRDVIRIASYNHHNVLVHFIYLSASEKVLIDRVHARVGHYMKDSMVKSQLETLEPPKQDETDVLSVDVSGNIDSVHRLALEVVHKVTAKDATEQGREGP